MSKSLKNYIKRDLPIGGEWHIKESTDTFIEAATYLLDNNIPEEKIKSLLDDLYTATINDLCS